MSSPPMNLHPLQQQIRNFADERDWHAFHTPKNLVMALAGEVGELVSIFQWLTPEESRRCLEDPTSAAAVNDELADVFIYLLRLADVLAIDLPSAASAKIRKNKGKYPVSSARGRATKYCDL